jgi:hypothetical protein
MAASDSPEPTSESRQSIDPRVRLARPVPAVLAAMRAGCTVLAFPQLARFWAADVGRLLRGESVEGQSIDLSKPPTRQESKDADFVLHRLERAGLFTVHKLPLVWPLPGPVAMYCWLNSEDASRTLAIGGQPLPRIPLEPKVRDFLPVEARLADRRVPAAAARKPLRVYQLTELGWNRCRSPNENCFDFSDRAASAIARHIDEERTWLEQRDRSAHEQFRYGFVIPRLYVAWANLCWRFTRGYRGVLPTQNPCRTVSRRLPRGATCLELSSDAPHGFLPLNPSEKAWVGLYVLPPLSKEVLLSTHERRVIECAWRGCAGYVLI